MLTLPRFEVGSRVYSYDFAMESVVVASDNAGFTLEFPVAIHEDGRKTVFYHWHADPNSFDPM